MKNKKYTIYAIVLATLIIITGQFIKFASNSTYSSILDETDFEKVEAYTYLNKEKIIVDIKDKEIFNEIWSLLHTSRTVEAKGARGYDYMIRLNLRFDEREYKIRLFKDKVTHQQSKIPKKCFVYYGGTSFSVLDDNDIVEQLNEYIFENGRIVIVED